MTSLFRMSAWRHQRLKLEILVSNPGYTPGIGSARLQFTNLTITLLLTMVPLRLTGSAWSAFTCVSLMLILTSLQASIIVSSSLSSYIVSGMPENSMQLRRLYYSSFGIWISRLLDFFLRLQHAVFWMTKSLFNISFLDKSWFAVSVNSFIWQQRLFISSPTITLSFKSINLSFIFYHYFCFL